MSGRQCCLGHSLPQDDIGIGGGSRHRVAIRVEITAFDLLIIKVCRRSRICMRVRDGSRTTNKKGGRTVMLGWFTYIALRVLTGQGGKAWPTHVAVLQSPACRPS